MSRVQLKKKIHFLKRQLTNSDEYTTKIEITQIKIPVKSECITEGIKINVHSLYLERESLPERNYYQWIYQVNIKNEGDETVQLISRHWIINHNNGKTENVGPKAPGVVGKYPVLRPGDSFEYNSGCPLRTPYGSMSGSFEMVVLEEIKTDDGRVGYKHTKERFDAFVAPFGLTMDGKDAIMPQEQVVGELD